MTDVVQKLWGFCHTLRHDGVDYGDYIEQITYLLFLKMADERGVELPNGCDWPSLREKTGTELTDFYIDVLRKLGKSPGVLGDIYAGAQSRFNNPVNLKRLITLIDETEWRGTCADRSGVGEAGGAGL
jgi:type I restriction enzyme M protein